ncbi:ATP-binding protein [Cryptosporangium arvum]|uniref:Transcriptional regulator, luxR family n=1 Tax=Cryptosporangium arvum DSM 44712 TaxID=927661 RepID=A0A010YYQ9_9ACTN|nr:LuxR family transcriptional regulator [Cryptosporangium arvum]EXG80358.1 transcriptional regulator, luxR family [Cryptosporangium arvum DSM 44712]
MWAPAQLSDPLVGRRVEKERLEALIAAARDGRGEALVVSGEAGIGKSALLDHAVEVAAGFEVVRASGSELEREMAFAALHQLCVPLLRRLPELSERHRTAVRVAFGLADGVPDLFHLGLAVLELMAAGDRPLLCLVDDAHWLDPASSRVLAFLGRRVAADRIALLFAARPAAGPDAPGSLTGLPALTVSPLNDQESAQLLAQKFPLPLDERVRDNLLSEARGNPLALLELPRAGGFLPPTSSPLPTRIQDTFRARLTNLNPDARSLLVLASADPTGDPTLLWPAARHLGLDVALAGAEATATGLAEFDARIRFCHPLARSAVYRAADPAELRTAHAALAEVTDPRRAPDRRAWHRAQASSGPDDEVAAELERCASRAQARGGVAAAAAFLRRSVTLTLDPARRSERTLTAAAALLDAGDADAAHALLATVDSTSLDGFQQARADVLRGRVAFTRPGERAGPMLVVSAARRLAPLDPESSRDCFVDALEMALAVGRARGVIDEVLAAARSSAPAAASPDLLDVVMSLAAEGPRGAVPVLDTVRAVHGETWWARRPALATMITAEVWDFATHTAIAAWLETTGRDTGSPTMLRLGLGQRASDAVLVGDVGQAIAAIAEEEAIADAIGDQPLVYPRLHLAALRGRRADALRLFRAATDADSGGDGGRVTNLHWATALLHNGLGNYPAALEAARASIEDRNLFHVGGVLVELVEAATRCDEPAVAAGALDTLTDHAMAGGTPTALGVAAYARGLVTGVEDDYREALARLAESPLVPYRGRAHLLYGEWLRRAGRRRDSSEQLRTAHRLLAASGAEGFARRAADELRAAGEKVSRRPGRSIDELTSQEVAVARLVAAGATSQEVAVQLFISKRTVDAHLRGIFRKLGLTSRRQLRDHRFGRPTN